ncbi:anti-sigma-D factor RsdA [Williamsia sterculiae]|uniref:Anti-sigma-D factor RsdA to sigma factor binding region n=1 Tax=Williamsia sterculiae TaxID=1344003 RepID=A0A1N7DV03_9NOCA|nr:anti-sigma-D factor RsdA [Williamsia sterculiae]SIR79664.1 Anti-sigma-D factor RsdA to sigma factor binding region [Williamsia sterculiae]
MTDDDKRRDGDPFADRQRGDRPENSTPLDLDAIRADDELLDAIARNEGVRVGSDVDYELTSLLAGWRHDVLAPGDTGVPTLEQVEEAIAAEQRVGQRHRSLRTLRIVGAAAALIIVAFGGLTVMSRDANPGDPLWGIKQTVFGADASATVASQSAQSNLEKAQRAMAEGKKAEALSYLQSAKQTVTDVREADGRDDMQTRIDQLLAQVQTQTSAVPTTVPQLPSNVIPTEITDLQNQLLPQNNGGSGSESQAPADPGTGADQQDKDKTLLRRQLQQAVPTPPSTPNLPTSLPIPTTTTTTTTPN